MQTDSIRPILAFDIGLELFERGSTAARREVGRRPQLPLAAGSFKFGEPVIIRLVTPLRLLTREDMDTFGG